MKNHAAALTLILAVATAGASGAATISAAESDAKGGDYSNSHANPTAFGQGVTGVTGSQNRKSDTDWLVFDAFAPEVDRLEFTFTNTGGMWGGLNLRLKDHAFENDHDWWPLLASWSIDNVTDARDVTVSYVLDGHTGPLYVALDFYKDNDFRNGNGLDYTIALIGGQPVPETAPAPIPLPAGGALALAAVAALGALRRFRRG